MNDIHQAEEIMGFVWDSMYDAIEAKIDYCLMDHIMDTIYNRKGLSYLVEDIIDIFEDTYIT